MGGPQQLEGELSGKRLVLAARREFDGLLCGPRGFSLIPLCVPACSPLTLSDKLLSRRLPVPAKKRPRSRRTLNPWPPSRGRQEPGAREQVWEGTDPSPSAWPSFFLRGPFRCQRELCDAVALAVCASYCLVIGRDQEGQTLPAWEEFEPRESKTSMGCRALKPCSLVLCPLHPAPWQEFPRHPVPDRGSVTIAGSRPAAPGRSLPGFPTGHQDLFLGRPQLPVERP